MDKTFRDAALYYHRHPTPGKISVVPTKSLSNQRDHRRCQALSGR